MYTSDLKICMDRNINQYVLVRLTSNLHTYFGIKFILEGNIDWEFIKLWCSKYYQIWRQILSTSVSYSSESLSYSNWTANTTKTVTNTEKHTTDFIFERDLSNTFQKQMQQYESLFPLAISLECLICRCFQLEKVWRFSNIFNSL